MFVDFWDEPEEKEEGVTMGGLQLLYLDHYLCGQEPHGFSWRILAEKMDCRGVPLGTICRQGVCEGGLHRRGQEVSACVGASVHHYQWAKILVDLRADWIWSRCIRLARILMEMVLNRCLIRVIGVD